MAQLSALTLARELPQPGPPPGRYWKIDVAKLDLESLATGSSVAEFELGAAAKRAGVVACSLDSVPAQLAEIVAQTQDTAVDWRGGRFAALNAAHRDGGAFVFVPQGAVTDEPIVIRHRLHGPAAYPYTLVVAGEGSRATVISRLEGDDELPLVSEIVEVVCRERSALEISTIQNLSTSARIFCARRGNVHRDAELRWTIAELGAALSIGDVRATLQSSGARASIAGVFFPGGDQHVDIQSEADHPAGQTQSETLFKSAAIGRGQARFVGNIRIHPAAHGVDATLRDDALLLSKNAHIDSIPALEIGANDVRAYHGATIGAIDGGELFYAMTRGIERSEAERMIALGFFEPAISRFPTEGLRYELRTTLARKVA